MNYDKGWDFEAQAAVVTKKNKIGWNSIGFFIQTPCMARYNTLPPCDHGLDRKAVLGKSVRSLINRYNCMYYRRANYRDMSV